MDLNCQIVSLIWVYSSAYNRISFNVEALAAEAMLRTGRWLNEDIVNELRRL